MPYLLIMKFTLPVCLVQLLLSLVLEGSLQWIQYFGIVLVPVGIPYILFCIFFSWRYNPRWGLYFHSPLAGFSLLAYEVS